MLLFLICEAPQKIQGFLVLFWPLLTYFTGKISYISKNLNSKICPKPDSDSFW